jgi:hypothetical protein
MPAVEGAPDWYRQAAEDVFAKRYDTPGAMAVVAEARSMIFKGQTVTDTQKFLKARGAGKRMQAISAYAAGLEWNAVVKAASTDVDAGQLDTEFVRRARQIAVHVIVSDPAGENFVGRFKAMGASEKLAELLAFDPEVTKAGRKEGMMLILAGLVLGAIFIFVWFNFFSGANSPPNGAAIVFFAPLSLIGTGINGLMRRPKKPTRRKT